MATGLKPLPEPSCRGRRICRSDLAAVEAELKRQVFEGGFHERIAADEVELMSYLLRDLPH